VREVAWGAGGERRVEVTSEESVLAEVEFLGRPIRQEARWQGADLAIRLYGGSRAHIGSVVFAVVRPSLRDPDITSDRKRFESPGPPGRMAGPADCRRFFIPPQDECRGSVQHPL